MFSNWTLSHRMDVWGSFGSQNKENSFICEICYYGGNYQDTSSRT
jgi:hypothetical protein